MLDLGNAAPAERRGAAALAQAIWASEACRRLHATLALEDAQRGGRGERPGDPGLRASRGGVG